MNLSIRSISRLVGVIYLFILFSAPFSMLYVPSKLFVEGDAGATVNNIISSSLTFRLGFLADIITFLSEIVLTVFLYLLLKPVSRALSLVSTSYRLAMTVLLGVNLLNYFFVLVLLSGASYLSGLGADQINSLVMLFINAHKHGENIWGLFFGFHLLVLGFLVFRSSYLPRISGALMMIGCFGFIIDGLRNFLVPNNEAISLVSGILLMLAFIGEVSFSFWLLLKGVKEPLPDAYKSID